jgi:hypothetical protein
MNSTQAIQELRSLGYDEHQAMAMLDEARDWGTYANGTVTVLDSAGIITVLSSEW